MELLQFLRAIARAIAVTAAVGLAAYEEGAARWPRSISLEQATPVVYQPQIENIEGVTMSGRMAVSGEPNGARFWYEAPEAMGPWKRTRPATPAASRPNDVHGDRNGNVYRQNDAGGWERRTSQGWESAGSSSRPGSDRGSAGGGGGSYGGGGGGRRR